MINSVSLPVDEEGQPVIKVCPADGCMSLDPWVMECAGGRTWTLVCDEGHLAFIARELEEGS